VKIILNPPPKKKNACWHSLQLSFSFPLDIQINNQLKSPKCNFACNCIWSWNIECQLKVSEEGLGGIEKLVLLNLETGKKLHDEKLRDWCFSDFIRPMKIEENAMGETCSTHWVEKKIHTEFWWVKVKKRDRKKTLGWDCSPKWTWRKN